MKRKRCNDFNTKLNVPEIDDIIPFVQELNKFVLHCFVFFITAKNYEKSQM